MLTAKIVILRFKVNTAEAPKTTPAGNYMFKVNNRNTRTRCEICLKLTIKIPERRQALF